MFTAGNSRVVTNAVLGVLLLRCSLSIADEAAAPNHGTNAVASFTGTIGWEFIHTGPHYHIYVTGLGVYDEAGNGLAGSHDVGLWTENGDLLLSASVPAGEVVPLERGYRYVSIEPFALIPGRYVIGGQFSAGDPDSLRFGPASGLGPELFFPTMDFEHGRYTVSAELSYPDLESGASACEGCGLVVPWVVSFQYTLEPPELRPRLSAFPAADRKVELRWPTSSPNYLLEFVPDLQETTWIRIDSEPVVIGEYFSITIEAVTGRRFFRLRKADVPEIADK